MDDFTAQLEEQYLKEISEVLPLLSYSQVQRLAGMFEAELNRRFYA